MVIFGNTTNTACWFSFKQYNLFHTIQNRFMSPAGGGSMSLRERYPLDMHSYLSKQSNQNHIYLQRTTDTLVTFMHNGASSTIHMNSFL